MTKGYEFEMPGYAPITFEKYNGVNWIRAEDFLRDVFNVCDPKPICTPLFSSHFVFAQDNSCIFLVRSMGAVLSDFVELMVLSGQEARLFWERFKAHYQQLIMKYTQK